MIVIRAVALLRLSSMRRNVVKGRCAPTLSSFAGRRNGELAPSSRTVVRGTRKGVCVRSKWIVIINIINSIN